MEVAMDTLDELAAVLEANGVLYNGEASPEATECWQGGPDDPFAIFEEPCRCRFCEPQEG
jgi:hypothetical protein